MQVKDESWYQCRDRVIRRAEIIKPGWHVALHGLHASDSDHVVYATTGRANKPEGCDHPDDIIREVSDPTKPMQLRVGGKYLDSQRIERLLELTPLSDRWAETHPFKAVGERLTYRLDGKTIAFGMDDLGFDLICEILDPATEPELVLVAGREYECDNGDKAIAVGIDPFNRTRNVMIVAFPKRSPWCYELDGVPTFRDSYPRIIRPWIDPPTEFVDPRTGKRYSVGPEIKEAAK